MKNPFLIGKSIYLRAYEPGDELIYAISENHPDAREFLFYGLPTSSDQQRIKAEKMVNDHNTILFTICKNEQDEVVGQTAFVRIDWIGRMATFYLAIAKSENWSKGYGKEIMSLMIEYAFRTLNLNRIQLHVSVENTRAVKLYESCGFKIEGTLREAMFRDNRYYDFYIMGLLKSDITS